MVLRYSKVCYRIIISTYFITKCIWVLKYLCSLVGIGLTRQSNLLALNETSYNLKDLLADRSQWDLEMIRALNPVHYELTIKLLSKAKSQLRQDLFVLSETKYKTGGYFIEFGATNGVDLSNTYLLEKEFLWRGILAEPAKVWGNQLRENRLGAHIETQCVWKDSNSSLTFNETDNPELSTINIFSGKDRHAKTRAKGKKYQVATISLNDLLKKYSAPKYIDYLSIDTEGSEFEILNAFDFNEYKIGIITVEHNYTPQRKLIFKLLTSHGYKRKYKSVSDFDDWYTKI